MGESFNPSAVSRLLAGLAAGLDSHHRGAPRRSRWTSSCWLPWLPCAPIPPTGTRHPPVVAARDLALGVELPAADVIVESHAVTAIPDGALSDPAARSRWLDAHGPDAPRRGDHRRAAAQSDDWPTSPAGPDARIVPLHLADTALLDLVRAGDVVDVSAAASDRRRRSAGGGDRRRGGPGVGEAEGARQSAGDRVVLVALPAHAANDVAGATLMQTVTLTFH